VDFTKRARQPYLFGLTLLPIADRELRVSARNKATHRWRILFAVSAVVVAGALGLLFHAARSGLPGSQLGLWMFGLLKWIAFVLACSAGVFLTADCLSEEKREGTLGLLFLTDLRGYDVVLGKLLATSLRTFYSLLAIFPVMSLSFVLGGVAADDFRHTLIALCNALFFSLALGMLVSVVSRDPHKAMTSALAGMALFLFLVPDPESPLFAFTHPTTYPGADFWHSIFYVQMTGWCFLALASWLAPKTWHEKGIRAKGWRLPFGVPGKERKKLLDESPISWIIARDRWASNLARLMLVLMLGAFAVSLASLFNMPKVAAMPGVAPTPIVTTQITTTSNATSQTHIVNFRASAVSIGTSKSYRFTKWLSNILSLVLEFWLAAQVCRFYIDGKRTGFFEQLLVTPVKPADIIRGHWLALRRLFLAPVIGQLLVIIASGILQLLESYSITPPTQAGGRANHSIELSELVMFGLGAVNWFLGLLTIAWYAIWMSLTSKRINVAMLKTFGYAKVIPWFGITFASGFFLFAGAIALARGSIWILPLLFQGLFIAVNIGLITYARYNAYNAFSEWSNLTAA
jgi:ABC-type transport system involved in cytochrome c biogenesis permease component